MTDVDQRNLKAKLYLENHLVKVDAELEEIRKGDGDDAWKAHQEETIGTIFEQINAALARIEDGTFGTCVVCGGPIHETQLNDLPHVAECMVCRTSEFPPGMTDEMRASAGADDKEEPMGIMERARQKMGLKADGSEDGVEDEPTTEELEKQFMDAANEQPGDEWSPPPIEESPATAVVETNGTSDDEKAPDLVERARAALKEGVGEPSLPAEGAGEKKFVDDPLPGVKQGKVRDLPIDQILPAKMNDRKAMDEAALNELAESIRSIGLLNRITVTPNDDGTFEIIAGHRRLEAIRLIGWDSVPVEVFDFDTSEVAVARLIENVQRQDLNPIEEAQALGRLVGVYGLSQRTLAQRIGRSQSHISKRLSLNELPERALELLDSGGITLEGAQEILKLKDYPNRFKRVAESFDPERPYADIFSTVARELSEQKTSDKKKANRQKLRDQGVRVLKESEWDYEARKKGAEIGKRADQLDVDRKEHAKEPCHAGFVETYNGAIRLVCTDKQRHTKKGESKLKGQVVQWRGSQLPGMSEEEETLRTDLTKAEEQRHAFIKTSILSAKATQPNSAFDVFFGALLWETADSNFWGGEINVETGTLCEWLGLVKDADDEDEDPDERIPSYKLLSDWLEKGSDHRAKALLVAGVAEIERSLEVQEYRDPTKDWGPKWKPYFDWLALYGYTISDIERELLEPKAEEKAKGAA